MQLLVHDTPLCMRGGTRRGMEREGCKDGEGRQRERKVEGRQRDRGGWGEDSGGKGQREESGGQDGEGRVYRWGRESQREKRVRRAQTT